MIRPFGRAGPGSRLPGFALGALLLAALLLGPALRPGLVLAYDLGWSPDPRLTPFVTGSSMVAPRAVPSDAFAVALGAVVGAGPAQKAVLLGILVLAALGPAHLLLTHTRVGLTAVAAASVAAVWNPFVAERLAIGQWTILLGYAVLGWLVAAVLRARTAGGSILPAAGWLAVAGVGGANTIAMTLPVALVVLLWPGRGGGTASRLPVGGTGPVRQRARAAAVATGVALGASAVWALPGLAAGVASDPGGAAVFRPQADTVLGSLGSLLTGGGMWNAAAHSAARGPTALVLALTALALAALAAGWSPAARAGLAPVLGVGVLGLIVVLASATPGVRALWEELLAAIPGGGILRDSQKLLAPWVLALALLAGFAVDRLMTWRRVQATAPILGAALTLAPLALQPTLIWGLAGRLAAHPVPADYRATATRLSAAEPGLVGVLPWNQYRRYPWNAGRVALSLAPRIVDQPVLQNDALPTRSGWVTGEDARAAAVTRAIAAGSDPVAALRAQGVRYLLIESDTSPATADRPWIVPTGARELAGGPSATAYDLGTVGTPEPPARAAHLTGWAITVLTWLAVLAAGARRARSRRGSAVDDADDSVTG